MTERPLLLLGGGGHASVVADAARAAGWMLLGYLDDDHDPSAPARLGLERLGDLASLARIVARERGLLGHAAVGAPELRRRFSEALGERLAPPLVHPRACVSESARLEDGVFIGALAIVNPRATIGRGAIINSGAVVEHDCVVGEFAHVAPGAVLGGDVRVGEDALVGLGARVRPLIAIGRGATLGAGAVAVKDVEDGATVVGNPAREKVSG